MFSQPVSSSHALWDLSGQISPDQSPCSSDTGDVLIRSTRAPLPSRKHGAGPGSVHITVHKLRDPPTTQCLSFRTEKQQRRPTPRQKPDTGAPARAAAEHQPGKSSSRWSELSRCVYLHPGNWVTVSQSADF